MNGGYLKQILCIVIGIVLISLSSLAWATPAQAADRFRCFQPDSSITGCTKKTALSEFCKEPPTPGVISCCQDTSGKKKDYSISSPPPNGSNVTVIAIHGGSIESYTSEISLDLANSRNWDRYIFSGHGRPQCLLGRSNFRTLHITSTNFNHQEAIDLVKSHSKSVSIHGYVEATRPDYPPGVICVGGKNEKQIEAFINYVKANSAAFSSQDGGYELHPIDTPKAESKGMSGYCVEPEPALTGTNDYNIVNRNSEEQGLQLELSSTMRKNLGRPDKPSHKTLQTIIFGAIDEAMGV
jgi:phage replication-related protein YjqB (UPF0714/DUF867 family)